MLSDYQPHAHPSGKKCKNHIKIIRTKCLARTFWWWVPTPKKDWVWYVLLQSASESLELKILLSLWRRQISATAYSQSHGSKHYLSNKVFPAPKHTWFSAQTRPALASWKIVPPWYWSCCALHSKHGSNLPGVLTTYWSAETKFPISYASSDNDPSQSWLRCQWPGLSFWKSEDTFEDIGHGWDWFTMSLDIFFKKSLAPKSFDYTCHVFLELVIII